jgi:hypothetical protein
MPRDVSMDAPFARTCANCGATLLGEWCHRCGQHRRESARLDLREIVARFSESLLNLDSTLLRTFVGLTIQPGQLCREYVEGHRKRYMNPFGYFVLAGAANLLGAATVARIFGEPRPPDAAEGELASEYVTWFMLGLLVPFALVLRRLFRRADRNLAENYVFALYVLGQFVWFELLILLPLTYAIPDAALAIAYVVGWITYVTFASVPFYSERWYWALAKVLLSLVALLAVLTLFAIAWAALEGQAKR